MADSLGAFGNIGGYVPYADMIAAANGLQKQAFTLSSAGVADTIAASQIVGGVYTRSGATAAVVATTDTAAAIITALGARVGQTFTFNYTNLNTAAGAVTMTGGTGVTISGTAVCPVGYTTRFIGTVVTATTITLANAGVAPEQIQPSTQFTSVSSGNGTAAAGALEGGTVMTIYASSGATALTTRTAAQMITQAGLAVGQSYLLRVYNTNGGTLTLTAGTGVTITGTATVATNVFRDYTVTVTGAATITFQNIGAGNAT